MILSWRQRRGAVRDRSSPGRKTAKKKRWISRRSPSSLSGHTFSGKRTQTLISNLSFGEESVNDDSVASAAGQEKSKYLGLFEEVYGTIEDVTLQNVTLTLGQNEESKTFNSLQGIGIFAGRSEGTMNHVAVTSAEDKGQTQVLVDFEKIRTDISVGSDTAAVGGISGIFADQDQSGNTLEALASGRMSDITMEGNVEVAAEDLD